MIRKMIVGRMFFRDLSPDVVDLTGSYKLETIIANACFLGTYEVPRDYMEEQLKLYYDDNQFHIPEKIVFKLYII
jgi:hypothetical protein